MELIPLIASRRVIERNTNECSRSDPNPTEVQVTAVMKVVKSTYKVQQQEEDLVVKLILQGMPWLDQTLNPGILLLV